MASKPRNGVMSAALLRVAVRPNAKNAVKEHIACRVKIVDHATITKNILF